MAEEKLVRLSDVEYYLRRTAKNIIDEAEKDEDSLTDDDKSQIAACALALRELADNAHRLPAVHAVAADKYEHLLRRLQHLLKSRYISTFDAVHPISHEYIRDIAEADGRPVVQCWECKRRGTPYDCPFRHLVHTEGRGYHYIDATTDDGYCSFGERKGAEA